MKRSVFRNGLDDKLVPVRGVVHVASELGVYLNMQDRQVFVPTDRTLSALRRLNPGKSSSSRSIATTPCEKVSSRRSRQAPSAVSRRVYGPSGDSA